MKSKDTIIIESAIKLFAQKGFNSTSIQEIATESGISKGAFYLHFKSKDSLLLAILNHYFDRLQKNVAAFDNLNLPPREKFIKQLTTLFETLIAHKEFIVMQSREQAIPLNDSTKELIFKMHSETHRFYNEGLLSIYGNKIEQHVWDLSFQLEGMFQSYIKVLLFDKEGIPNLEKLVQYILRRMDSIILGLENEKPILSKDKMEDLIIRSKAFFMKNPNQIKDIIVQLKNAVHLLEDNDDLVISLEVLENEIGTDNPRIPVIQGMLSNFYNVPGFEKYTKSIAAFYNIKQ